MTSCSESSSYDSQSNKSISSNLRKKNLVPINVKIKKRHQISLTSSVVSRKKIISRSLEELYSSNSVNFFYSFPYEYDIWYHEDKFYKDHIQEIIKKWHDIDNEIWGKIIFMERNQRIAKAYIRSPVISINGSWDSFDGQSFGLKSLPNPIRDDETSKIISNFAEGIKVMINRQGNIFMKKSCRCNVFIQGWHKDFFEPNSCSISDDLIESRGRIGINQLCKVFDMDKFKENVLQELKSAKPDKTKLELQCLTILAIGQDSPSLLTTPCWIIVVNIVAFGILKQKLKKNKVISLAGSAWSTFRKTFFSNLIHLNL